MKFLILSLTFPIAAILSGCGQDSQPESLIAQAAEPVKHAATATQEIREYSIEDFMFGSNGPMATPIMKNRFRKPVSDLILG